MLAALCRRAKSAPKALLRFVFSSRQRVEGFPSQERIDHWLLKNLSRLRDHFPRSDDLRGLSPFQVRGHPVGGGPFAHGHDDVLIIPDQFSAIAAFEYTKHAIGSGVWKRLEQPRRQLAIRASAICHG